jgi:hypothetical protein
MDSDSRYKGYGRYAAPSRSLCILSHAPPPSLTVLQLRMRLVQVRQCAEEAKGRGSEEVRFIEPARPDDDEEEEEDHHEDGDEGEEQASASVFLLPPPWIGLTSNADRDDNCP